MSVFTKVAMQKDVAQYVVEILTDYLSLVEMTLEKLPQVFQRDSSSSE